MRPLRILLDFISYDGTLSNDPADATKIKNKIEESNISELIRNQLIITDSTVDQVIAFPDPNSDYLLILIDREVTIKLNGSSDSLTLKPRANGTKSLGFFCRGDITGLTISNASGSNANVDILAVNI